MSSANYPACLKFTLGFEGGYSNHPADPGGVTLEGVIQRVYDAWRDTQGKPRQRLTAAMRNTPAWVAERNAIYRESYWNKVLGDQWPAGADLAVWDCGVNSGPDRSRKLSMAVLPNAGVTFSGLAASCRAMNDKTIFVKKFCAKRLAFVQALKTFATFGKGWSRRIAECEATGVAMALRDMRLPEPEVAKHLENEAAKADKSKNANAGGAAAGGTASTSGGSSIDWSALDWVSVTLLGLAVAAGIVATVYFIHWTRNHNARAEAYRLIAKITGA